MTKTSNIPTWFRIIFSGILSILFLSLHSQDVHFSQSVVSIQQRNFSISNNYQGDYQIYSAYREQWGSIGVPFKSSILGFNTSVYSFDNGITFFSGIQYFNDESGDGKLTINQFNVNLAASYQLEENTFLFGVNNGIHLKQFNSKQLTFPEQYDRNTGGFNEQLASGENLNNQDLSFWSLGINMGWKRTINDKLKILSGISIDNLNKPNESFFNETNKLAMGVGIQGLAEYYLKKRMDLMPYLNYYKLGAASETVLGSGIRFKTTKESNVQYIQPFVYARAGFGRNIDALIIGTHLGIGNFDLGASYDFNISDLELASNYQGAFELSLIFVPKHQSIKKRAIPCERF
ncbi:MAG: PorP/SprF family type IX secretion system membrane protein [Bacteroidetes bacterium]|nr:hypothetical protein [Bacteroidota bacterium]NOG58457.1 PorP/SprF family type IX secretion system membrane protein [Bacteroidota bacterium]